MISEIRLFDVVALAADKPEQGLLRGQVGTVVEVLDGAFEVEFADQDGKTYALGAFPGIDLIVLHYERVDATG